jgi:protein FAM32A
MSEYDIRPGGSLKLKGGVADGGIVKKKYVLQYPILPHSQRTSRKKSKSKTDKGGQRERERERVRQLLENAGGSPSGSSRNSPAIGGDRKTDAERRFEEAQRRRASLPTT